MDKGAATTPMMGAVESQSSIFTVNPDIFLRNDSEPSKGSIKKYYGQSFLSSKEGLIAYSLRIGIPRGERMLVIILSEA